jgi:hypothetical protein
VAKRPKPSITTGGFDTRTGRLLPSLTPALNSAAMDFQSIIKNDDFLSNFQTEEDRQAFADYQIGQTLEKNIGVNPYKPYADFKATYDTKSKPLSIADTDDDKTKAFKDIYNDIVKNDGAVASPNFWRKTAGQSMTNGWVKAVAGKDLIGKLGEFSTTEGGIRYDGNKLDLDKEELDLVNKYVSRIAGNDEDQDFFDKVLETGMSLMWDMPLLAVTGAISSGAVGLAGRSVGQALNITTKGIGRIAGNVAQQAVNFNILGLPQTVESVKEQGIGAGVDSILHNVWMGTLATMTGQAGRLAFGNRHVPIIKEIFKRRPALREELAGLGGSFGFGYVSGKLEGQENEDAFAQALAFAGTHFTNPRAYRRVLAEQKAKNLRVRTEIGEEGRRQKDYFLEEDGQLFKINKELFQREGRISKMEGYNPIKMDAKSEAQYPFYNEIQSEYHLGFGKALELVRGKKSAEKLLERWKENVPKEYFEKYRDDLETLALSTALGIEGIKYRKIFTDWKLPEDSKLHNKMVEISDKYQLRYQDVKKHIVSNVDQYLKDREGFSERLIMKLGLGEEVAKDLQGGVELAAKLLTEGTGKLADQRMLKKALQRQAQETEALKKKGQSLYVRGEAIDIAKEGLRMQAEGAGGSKERIKFLEQRVQEAEVGSPIRAAAEEVLSAERLKIEEAKQKKMEEKDAKKQEMPKGEGGEVKTPERKPISQTDFEALKKLGFSEEQIQRIPEGQEKRIIERELSPEEFKFPKEEAKAPKVEEPVKENPADLMKQRVDIAGELQKLNPTVPIAELAKALEAGTSKGTKKRLKKGSQEIIERYKGVNDKVKKIQAELKEKKFVPETKKKKFKAKDKSKAIPKKEAKVGEDTPLKEVPQSEFGKDRLEKIVEASKEYYDQTKNEKIDLAWGKNVKEVINNFSNMKDLSEKLAFPKHLKPLMEMLDKLGVTVSFDPSVYNGAYSQRMGDGKNKRILLNPYVWTSNGKRGVDLRNQQKWIVDGKTLQEVIVHEGIHGLLRTLEASDSKVGNELKSELQKLQRQVEKVWFKDITEANKQAIDQTGELSKVVEGINPRLRKRIEYMLDNRSYQEFATIGLTEPMFARFLDSIPASEGVGKASGKTVWNDLVGWVRAFYKTVTNAPASKLDELTNLLNNYAKNQTESIESYSKSNISSGIGGSERITKPLGNNIRVLNEKAMNTKYDSNIVERFKKSEYDARPEGERKNNRPAEVESFRELQAEMQRQDTKQTRESGLVDVSAKGFKQMAKDDKIIKLHTNLKKYADLNVPPVFYAEMSEKFRDRVYQVGEAIIRDIPLLTNTIFRNKKGWNEGRKFNKLMFGKEIVTAADITGQRKITEDGQQFLDAVRAYEYGRNNKKIERELSWDEFADWAGFNHQQRTVLDAYKNAQLDAIEQMKFMKSKYIAEFDENPAVGLKKKAVERLSGEPVEAGKLDRAIRELNQKAKTDPELKERIARAVVDQSYRGWGETFYYNGIRPANPETFLADVYKKNSNGELIDREFTYFNSKKEMDQYLAEKKAAGWDTKNADAYQIKDLIDNGTYMQKLNAHQLMELANAGHIPLNNEVIQKLMEATKVGVDLHGVQKEYIKGMKYTPEEFERQFDRFIRESVMGAFKGYSFTKIRKNLQEWESELVPRLKKGERAAQLEKLEYEYGQRYFNQLKQKEHTVVDGIRGAAIAFQVGGAKPAFLVQQGLQVFQTTLANAVGEVKRLNVGGVGEAIKHFNKSITEAISYSYTDFANRFGKDLEYPPGMKISKESYDLIKQLESANKIGGTGIRELTAEANSIDYKYADKLNGVKESSLRTLNALGKAVEKWSRVQTALTHEKIGRAKGLKGKELFDYVAQGIDKSLAEWGKGGRAPIFDSKSPDTKGNVVTQALKKSFSTYKTFSFYNYGMWRSMIHNKQNAALWTKASVGLGMHGITKFPLFASVFLLADLFTDDDIDNIQWEAADWLNENVAKGSGDILHRGLGGLIGLDLRQTFGEDTPLVTDLYAESWADTWDGKLMEITLGAPFGFSKDIVNGIRAGNDLLLGTIFNNKLMDGDDADRMLSRMSKLMPVSVRNFIRGATLKEDGFEVQGKQIVTSDEITPRDVFYKIMSAPISKQTRAYNDAKYGPEARYNRAKQILNKGKTHRKEFTQKLIKQGVTGEEFNIIVQEEMKKVAKHMNEARETIRELEQEVREIKRKRKQQEYN